MTQAIAITGCLTKLPPEFPVLKPENSGNMIHANAPLRIFKNAVYIRDNSIAALGHRDVVTFINKHCSHLIVTFANTLRLGDVDDGKYSRTLDFLSKIEKPIVVFGLGVQSRETDLESAELPPSAKLLLKYLSEKAQLLGVRGPFTKAVIERLTGVKNAFVTGCPSVFSDLSSLGKVRDSLRAPVGRASFSGTRYFEDDENRLFQKAIEADHWLVEPVNKLHHEFYIKCCRGEVNEEEVPYHFKRFKVRGGAPDFPRLKEYFQSRYQIFRDVDNWMQFNREMVSHAYGTRFHVNMAALIAGKPALWITHDARTRELTSFMSLPSLAIEAATDYDFSEPIRPNSYEQFFDNFSGLLENFNLYLRENGLPILSSSY